MSAPGTRKADHFERMYQENPDPWGFATSAYEQAKYDATLAALGTRRFHAALEVGCSIGVLTERLAGRCDRLTGVDFAVTAVEEARKRCAALPHVHIEQLEVPRHWPSGQFDLILFSEVLYFLATPDLRQTCERALASLAPRGLVLLVNYTGPAGANGNRDPQSGESATEVFVAAAGPRLQLLLQQQAENYRLDLLQG